MIWSKGQWLLLDPGYTSGGILYWSTLVAYIYMYMVCVVSTDTVYMVSAHCVYFLRTAR